MDIRCPRCDIDASPVGHEDAYAYFQCPSCSRVWAKSLTSMLDHDGPSPLGIRVLVADDSDELAGLVAAWLEDERYEVVTASSGRQTLDAAAVYRPDILLLDLVMPAPGGFEICEVVRRQPEPPEIILMTGLSDRDHLQRALELGAGLLLRKPFTREAVIEAVAAAAERRRRNQGTGRRTRSR